MSAPTVRRATEADLDLLKPMRQDLWDDLTPEENDKELRTRMSGHTPTGMATVVLIAELDGEPVGFMSVDLRSAADGCDWNHPVAYVEGWYVKPRIRRKGVGRALIAAAEEWAREQGCIEFASDTWIENDSSRRAHEAAGFEEVDRVVHYRKRL